MKPKTNLNWDFIWDEFDTIYEYRMSKGTKVCELGHKHIQAELDWPDQKEIIQDVVESAVKGLIQ